MRELVARELAVVALAGVHALLRIGPARLQHVVRQRAEADAPAFEDNDLDGRLSGSVDLLPRLGRRAVAGAREARLVVDGNLGRLFVQERGEDGPAEVEVVGAGLTAVLDERVGRVGRGEGDLVVVGQVEVVDAEDGGGERVGRGTERAAEGGDLREE